MCWSMSPCRWASTYRCGCEAHGGRMKWATQMASLLNTVQHSLRWMRFAFTASLNSSALLPSLLHTRREWIPQKLFVHSRRPLWSLVFHKMHECVRRREWAPRRCAGHKVQPRVHSSVDSQCTSLPINNSVEFGWAKRLLQFHIMRNGARVNSIRT